MRATVYDIARELGIAQGTVSKALTGSPGVSPELREKVLETARRMGYRYNRYARSLASTPVKIGITYPDVWHEYYSRITKGIDDEIDDLEDRNVSVELKKFSSLYGDEEMAEIIDQFIAEGDVKGVLLFPSSTAFRPEIYKKLDNAGIAYVVVAHRIEEMESIPSVRIDAEMSGRLASDALSLALPSGSACAVIAGTMENREHLKKTRGFEDGAARHGLRYIGEYCSMDDPGLAFETADRLITDHPDVKGIYVVSANSVGVCRCIDEKYRDRGIKLIGTDIFDAIVPYIESGVMTATIYQSPSRQGRIAITSLYDRITTRKKVENDITVAPFLLMKSNYRPFLDV
ncbi:MAG: LacI family DNA-binding transcriptional regulator [Clostridia bacterium]|nr:LacI family DNA-binding transcriptional regulator [Clostridia bacterium]